MSAFRLTSTSSGSSSSPSSGERMSASKSAAVGRAVGGEWWRREGEVAWVVGREADDANKGGVVEWRDAVRLVRRLCGWEALVGGVGTRTAVEAILRRPHHMKHDCLGRRIGDGACDGAKVGL